MADVTTELLKAQFRQLRLPTMGASSRSWLARPPRPTRASSSTCCG